MNTGCVHPLKVSGTQRWLQLRCVKALLLIGCYTTTTCFGWNSATNLASGWEDFRNSSHYLYVLHHGHLLLLKPKNLLLVWLVDVGHLVILRPIPSAHLTARSRWFVPVRAHGTGPAMLHTHTHTHTHRPCRHFQTQSHCRQNVWCTVCILTSGSGATGGLAALSGFGGRGGGMSWYSGGRPVFSSPPSPSPLGKSCNDCMDSMMPMKRLSFQRNQFLITCCVLL